ncbi:MAG: hypothetical protein MJ202_02170 [Lentisphaeria bacterium]|nr:hypothetical protein [Lentisphaeria bacterium]
MPTSEQLRDRLIAKLQELFQLNQPELDFGFYRLMHAKAAEVNDFLTHTLPQTIDAAFGTVSESQKAELQAAVDKAIATAKEFGAPNPEETEPVKKARAALAAAMGSGEEQGAIYDHLYRFFERYYDRGDFVSTRYMTRETANNPLFGRGGQASLGQCRPILRQDFRKFQ